MIQFHELMINILALIIIPLSDLVLTIFSTDNILLLFINLLNLLQSYLYTISYYSLNKQNNDDNNTSNKSLSIIDPHYYLFYFAIFSLIIYSCSFIIQLFNILRTSNPSNLSLSSSLNPSKLKTNLSQNLLGSPSIENSFQSSMINNFAQSLSNSISNSINLSPSLTNLSRKSNDALVFKIDDILSPYSIKDQSNQQLSLISYPVNDISNMPQFNLQNNNSLNHLKSKNDTNTTTTTTNNNIIKSFKATPVLATLLALSATPSPSNAIPIINIYNNNKNNNIIIDKYNYFNNSNSNFILSLLINFLNLTCSLNLSLINIFKSSINSVNWILISFYKFKLSSINNNNNSVKIDTVIPLFNNKLMIFSNSFTVLLSFGITLYVIYSNLIHKYSNNEQEADNKSLFTNTVQNYDTIQ